MNRYAIVTGLSVDGGRVAQYLPRNYRVIWTGRHPAWPGGPEEPAVVIQGQDSGGWTLDRYVAPRLGSGMLACRECDLSHPIMAQVPA